MACAEALLRSLRRQPLLVVLRPGEPLQAIPMLESLQSLGLIHVEIAWQPQVGWVAQMAELRVRFPDLELGAASVCEPQGVDEAASAGCRYAVSPVLDAELLQEALRRDLLLVPGVMTASEVHRARQLGCRIVKLFPAVSVGREHWRRLRDPLGSPLPFCIAAGGLTPADVQPWLAAGVDAVALGSGLGDLEAAEEWRKLLAALGGRADQSKPLSSLQATGTGVDPVSGCSPPRPCNDG
ncbi:MAG: bifunctional 4-hydroxy-2-oxoglutarate aldolase/2-dehydro-3-deoxy-phosphogluconate aldolase [Cyanobium sp.]